MGTNNCKSSELEINPDSITIVTKDQVKYETFQTPPQFSEVPLSSFSSPPPEIPETRQIATPATNRVSFQGELEKYQPGFRSKFMTRWVVLTPLELKYYKNEYSSCFNFDKPIGLVNLVEVKEVLCSQIEKQFEVVLKNSNFVGNQNKTNKNNFGTNEEISRILFACKDEEEFNKWIDGLKVNGLNVVNN